MATLKGSRKRRRSGPQRGPAASRAANERLQNISRDPTTQVTDVTTEKAAARKEADRQAAINQRIKDIESNPNATDIDKAEAAKLREVAAQAPGTITRVGTEEGERVTTKAELTTGDLEDIAAQGTDLRTDFGDVPGGISGVLKAQEELERRAKLDDKAALERAQAALIATGADEEELLRASQELIRKVEKDEAVRQQTEAEALAQRTLIREKQALAAAGVELDLQGKELKRQGALLEQSLTEQFAQLDFAGAEIGRQETTLAREAASTRRQGALAARSAQASIAQAANLASQSGFKSSALAGLQASAQAQASTQAGDILTGLVGIGRQQESLAGKRDLLALEREGITLRGRAAESDLLAADVRLGQSRDKLATAQEDILFEQERLASDLQSNLDFIQETFTIGGDINRFSERLGLETQAAAERAAQRQNLIGGITSGASLGSSFGVGGAVAGGIAGGVLSLL